MKKSFLLLLTALALCLRLIAQELDKKPHIEVYGHSEETFEPNEIYIRVVLSEGDKKGKVTVFQQEKTLLKIADRLEIPKQDIQLISGNTQYETYFWRKSQSQTTKVYQIKIHSALQAGQLLYELDRAEFKQAKIIKVSRSDVEKLIKDLEIKAVKDARERANVLTRSIGSKIGKSLKIICRKDYSNKYPKAISYRMANDIKTAGNPYNAQQFGQFEFEKIKYDADVEVWFEID